MEKMKKYLFLAFLGASCTPKLANNPQLLDKNDMVQQEVKVVAVQGNPMFKVKGKLLQTAQHCGGIAPTTEILKGLQTPHPVAGEPLIVRFGHKNKLGATLCIRTLTNEYGEFSFELPKGDYCLSLGEKENSRSVEFENYRHLVIQQSCDKDWLEKCDQTFSLVDHDIEEIELLMYKKCFVPSFSPCIDYVGPMPP